MKMPAHVPPASPYCTIGPFFPYQFVDDSNDLTQCEGKTARGEHILLSGRVVEDGNIPTSNTILEIWQPDANGVFRHPLDPQPRLLGPLHHIGSTAAAGERYQQVGVHVQHLLVANRPGRLTVRLPIRRDGDHGAASFRGPGRGQGISPAGPAMDQGIA